MKKTLKSAHVSTWDGTAYVCGGGGDDNVIFEEPDWSLAKFNLKDLFNKKNQDR